MYDKLTEYPDKINVLERMNIYQEVILAAIYRILPTQLQVTESSGHGDFVYYESILKIFSSPLYIL